MFQRNRAVRTAKCEILPRFFSRDVHSMWNERFRGSPFVI
jgi:hypothetical protein